MAAVDCAALVGTRPFQGTTSEAPPIAPAFSNSRRVNMMMTPEMRDHITIGPRRWPVCRGTWVQPGRIAGGCRGGSADRGGRLAHGHQIADEPIECRPVGQLVVARGVGGRPFLAGDPPHEQPDEDVVLRI